MTFTYTISKKDYTQAMRHHYRNMLYTFLFSLLMLGFIGYMIAKNSAQGYTFINALSWFFAGIFFVYLFSILKLWLSLGKNYLKVLQLHGELTSTLYDDAFFQKGDFGETRYKWHAFAKLAETEELMLLYTSVSTFFILPKQAMDEEMMAFVREKVSKK